MFLSSSDFSVKCLNCIDWTGVPVDTDRWTDEGAWLPGIDKSIALVMKLKYRWIHNCGRILRTAPLSGLSCICVQIIHCQYSIPESVGAQILSLSWSMWQHKSQKKKWQNPYFPWYFYDLSALKYTSEQPISGAFLALSFGVQVKVLVWSEPEAEEMWEDITVLI